MAQSIPNPADDARPRLDAVAEIDRLRREIAEANPDLTDEDWDALADEWAEDVKRGMASRGKRKNVDHQVL